MLFTKVKLKLSTNKHNDVGFNIPFKKIFRNNCLPLCLPKLYFFATIQNYFILKVLMAAPSNQLEFM